jgi:DNA-3-methyladenine glycosylase I
LFSDRVFCFILYFDKDNFLILEKLKLHKKNEFDMILEPKSRCHWCGNDALYQHYHDTEWGKPVYDDAIFFEFLLLETFQAGLSWITILRKRENFKNAFDNFDYKLIAQYGEPKIQELLSNAGIIRNKLKINSAQTNALLFIDIQRDFGSFSNFIWRFVENKPVLNKPNSLQNVPATSPLSDTISKDLKKRGFKFVGSTVVYAFLQATGIVNDHVRECFLFQPTIEHS